MSCDIVSINWNTELDVESEALARVRSFGPGAGLSGVTDRARHASHRLVAATG